MNPLIARAVAAVGVVLGLASEFSASVLRAGGWLGAAAFVVFVVASALLPLLASSRPQSWVTAPAASTITPADAESGA